MQNIELTDNQIRITIDTIQLYEAYKEALQKSLHYKGGMHWKRAKGKEYLFKTIDSYGNGKSLGRRSLETEKIKVQFHKNKQESSKRLKSLQQKLNNQARFCKAARIQRVPRIAAKLLRRFELQKILGKNMIIIGTNALYAYEAGAGIFFNQENVATADMDILWDIRHKLTLAIDNKSKPVDFIDILCKVDKTFEIMDKQKFRVVNQDGYMVDLLKTVPSDIFKKERIQMGGTDDLEAVEIMNLYWLLSSPKYMQTVIGDDGFPATMVVPDPRAFALHKIWVSQQVDREPRKKRRDKNQGISVAQIIIKYMPQYQFRTEQLRMFPKSIIKQTA